MSDPALDDLLDGPAPAVLTTYRKNGTAVGSPVWFRATEDQLQVVIADGDVKLKHLRADPRCSLLVFETRAPFRGFRVEGTPTLTTNGADDARAEIAEKYLGPEGGRAFTAARGDGVIVSLPRDGARTWDLSPILPVSEGGLEPPRPNTGTSTSS